MHRKFWNCSLLQEHQITSLEIVYRFFFINKSLIQGLKGNDWFLQKKKLRDQTKIGSQSDYCKVKQRNSIWFLLSKLLLSMEKWKLKMVCLLFATIYSVVVFKICPLLSIIHTSDTLYKTENTLSCHTLFVGIKKVKYFSLSLLLYHKRFL